MVITATVEELQQAIETAKEGIVTLSVSVPAPPPPPSPPPAKATTVKRQGVSPPPLPPSPTRQFLDSLRAGQPVGVRVRVRGEHARLSATVARVTKTMIIVWLTWGGVTEEMRFSRSDGYRSGLTAQGSTLEWAQLVA